MAGLADKIRKARESTVESGGFKFTIRRPTDAEAVALGDVSTVQLLGRFVVGWNMKEIDLLPGGSPIDAPFDAEAFTEWVSDQPDVSLELSKAVVDSYKAHVQKRGEAEKN